ncbi:Fe(3+) dicitrate transport ATP-binding protein FecE [Ensifer sp. M14]|uniref:ABC transporter ATP-binding protein n=1 Tax=Ensifer sp. M14 TaxID=2203782 RepID=UPI000E1CCC82|nr:ABC transporter ATP-binding protein [Ensifer sp. M14]RDL47054.1 Fe(3+) dicitrate transport ATP-binding protein FecE [Ensifer sp. M14]
MIRLVVSNLSASLGGNTVLRDIAISVSPGEFVGLIGPNGAGKSTLLRACLGLIPSSGEILLAGRDLRQMAASELARHVAYVAQDRDIAWPITVEALVDLGRQPHRGAFARPAAADREAVEAALQRMDIVKLRSRRATDLSGGEKARVLIARALVQEADLLLADEPVAGLDPAHQIALMQVFRALAQQGTSVVASMHDLGLAARWCDRLVLLEGGHIVADGPPATVLTADLLRRVYGIEAYVAEAAGGLIVQPTRLAQTGIEQETSRDSTV